MAINPASERGRSVEIFRELPVPFSEMIEPFITVRGGVQDKILEFSFCIDHKSPNGIIKKMVEQSITKIVQV